MAAKKPQSGKTDKLWNMGKNGGFRPGSGRKPADVKTTLYGKKEVFWKVLTTDKLEKIIESLLKRAVYNSKDAHYVIDQVIGKSAQRVELTGKDGEALALTITQIE